MNDTSWPPHGRLARQGPSDSGASIGRLAFLLSGSLLLAWVAAGRRPPAGPYVDSAGRSEAPLAADTAPHPAGTPIAKAIADVDADACAALEAAAPPAAPPDAATGLPAPTAAPGLRPHAGVSLREVALRFAMTFKKALGSWVDDYAMSMGAALSYYTLFSIGPLLLIVVSVAGLVFGEEAARGEIFAQLTGLMGADGAAAIAGLLQAFDKPSSGLIGAAIGVTVLFIGATSVFGELQDALDRIWRAPPRASAAWWSLLKTRLLSFGMVLTIGFLLIVSLVMSAVLAYLGRWWDDLFGGWTFIAQFVDVLVSFGLMTLAFAMIYKIMPRVKVRWFDVWIGAAVTALLFAIGKFLIGLYIGRSGVVSGFGAASSIVVVLVWVYYSAQIFLLGAEFTWVFSHTFGSRRHVAENPVHEAPGVPNRVADGVMPVDSRTAAAGADI